MSMILKYSLFVPYTTEKTTIKTIDIIIITITIIIIIIIIILIFIPRPYPKNVIHRRLLVLHGKKQLEKYRAWAFSH